MSDRATARATTARATTARATTARATTARATTARATTARATTARATTARATTARATTARATTPRATTARATTPRTAVPRTPAKRATPVRPELRLVGTAAPAGARPRRHTRHDATRRRAPFVLLVVGLLVGTTLGLLILNTAIAVDSLKATQLQAENAERAQDVQRLERRVVAGGSPAQIAAAAAAAGLVPAGPAGYLVIAPDGSVELRGTPEPAPAPDAEPTDGG
ncbi:hypothetical protein GCM10010531_25450 [Blastococcus jejuensis]|uniref:Cell division protein FtsL n=1 Tax=Blastococcus jejuensis TaxID=351224 RepID=A0ABP6P8F3_9ACTN